MKRRTVLQSAGVAVAANVFALTSTAAADFPQGNMRMVTAYPPGGTADVVARLLGTELATALGRNVVVDNRPGGNTVIGTREVLNAPRDGLTLLFTSAPLLANLVLYKPAPWQIQEFVPLAFPADLPYLIVTSNKTPVKNFRELMDYAAKGSRVLWGVPGAGGPSHMLVSKLGQLFNYKPEIILYKGQPPVLTDLIGQQLDASLITPFPALFELVKQGRARVLGVFARERMSELPDTPTNAELGLEAADIPAWLGLFAASGVPVEIRDRITAVANAILAKPEFQNRVRQTLLVPGAPANREQLERRVQADYQAIARVVRDNNIQLER